MSDTVRTIVFLRIRAEHATTLEIKYSIMKEKSYLTKGVKQC